MHLPRTVSAIFLFAFAGYATNYYVSPTGSNSRAGTSAATSWRSAAGLSSKQLSPGDSILFEAGATHDSLPQIALNPNRVTRFSPDTPVVVTTYPRTGARATLTIASTTAHGIDIYNVGGVDVRNLFITGPGATATEKTGISLYCDLNGDATRLRRVRIEECEVSGFKTGIQIGAWAADNATYSGFRNVRVDNCDVHDNRSAGISSWGMYPGSETKQSHDSLYIGHCRVWNNKGDITYTANHSGNGIVLGEARFITIEYCTAWNNGELNGSTQGNGPCGIWLYDVDHGVIQNCIAYGNKTGANRKDGNGFDLDGGCTNCTMQYNYSYNNEGSGYLICQFSDAPPFRNNVVRYNISWNDGSASQFGGIHFYSAGSNGGIQNTLVYGNTIYGGYGPPVRFQVTSGISGTKFWNNVFVASSGKPAVDVNPSLTVAQFQGNCYWSLGTSFSVAGHQSLAAWRTGSGQEMISGNPAGIQADPLLVVPGAPDLRTDPDSLPSILGFRLNTGSPCINSGIDLQSAFSTDPGDVDFGGGTIPQGAGYDIGAREFVPQVGVLGAGPGHSPALSAARLGVFDFLGRRVPGPGSPWNGVRFSTGKSTVD